MTIVRCLCLDGDHLRVCGADRLDLGRTEQHEGSSPRVRSRRYHDMFSLQRLGIISACAEQTPSARSADCSKEDHLRVCGADLFDGSSV